MPTTRKRASTRKRTYRSGERVTFSVGELVLGSAMVDPSIKRVTPAHLVPEVAGDVAKIKNQKLRTFRGFCKASTTTAISRTA
jgi:hypothetical protein